ncbi:multiple sugar transport system substrate-binding protein [Streptomonospora nanhaiensis]|uniref:Multiple sugar transport system substrate-binding protein n=1 Tax=Streptomonospora nanhaiensis TaxID=1323731 RepID=A0A853BKR5_9ACTN|nr:extracellular solute-binding protein [Streptomonospora nanhaiensis]NYI95247.1 multiple sugar transport system substrate-binding protein [Streptomonospora nanhaiensis]
MDHRRPRAVLATAVTAVLSVLALVGGLLASGPMGAGAPATITVVTRQDVSGTGLYRLFVEEWNARRAPGEPRAELVEISSAADLVHAEFVRWTQTEGFTYDVLNIDNQWTAEFARNGWVEPVPGDVAVDAVLGPSIASVTYDEKVWAVPFIADVGLLYYRSDLLDAADLEGRNWAGTLDLLRATAEAEGVAYGYSGQFAPYEGLTVNMLELMYGMRGGQADEDRPVAFASGPGRSAVDLVARGLGDGTVHPGVLGDGATEYDSFRHFVDGEVVAMRNWPGWYDVLARDPAAEPARGEQAGGPPAEAEDGSGGGGAAAGAEPIEFDVVPLPGESVLGGQSLTVSRDSDQAEAAWDLVEYLTAPEQQRRLLYCGGYSPAREDAYSGAVAGPCPGGTGDSGASVADRRGEEYTRLLLDEVANARHRPTSPYYPRYTQVLYTDLNRLLRQSDGPPPESELAALETRLEGALEGR